MKNRCFAFTALITLAAARVFAMASSQASDGYTLLLVPDRYNTLQLGRDIHDRFPVLLLSYEFPGNPADPYIHAWNNGAWTQIPAASFASGDYLRAKPSRTIVVGEDNDQTRALIDTATAWSQEVLNAPAAKSADMVNTVGRSLNFSKSDYRYFANRHGFLIEDINAERRSQSWYDQPREKALSDVDPKLSSALKGEEDASTDPVPATPAPGSRPASAILDAEPAPMRTGLPPAKADKAATE